MKGYIYSLIAALVLLPQFSQAYSTSEQTATLYGETIAIYTIEYRFGQKANDLYLPVVATRDLAWKESETELGFEILEDKKRLTDAGTAQAIVVSEAPIVDGMYFVPAGSAATFTLYVILSTDPEAHEADYAVGVSNLPFYVGEEKRPNALLPAELESYLTPEVEFNASNPSK